VTRPVIGLFCVLLATLVPDAGFGAGGNSTPVVLASAQTASKPLKSGKSAMTEFFTKADAICRKAQLGHTAVALRFIGDMLDLNLDTTLQPEGLASRDGIQKSKIKLARANELTAAAWKARAEINDDARSRLIALFKQYGVVAVFMDEGRFPVALATEEFRRAEREVLDSHAAILNFAEPKVAKDQIKAEDGLLEFTLQADVDEFNSMMARFNALQNQELKAIDNLDRVTLQMVENMEASWGIQCKVCRDVRARLPAKKRQS
jgi:hypothetical protein